MAKKYADYNTLERMLYNIKLKFAALVHTHVPSEVGLSNVENKSGATIRSEMTQTEVTNALTYTPVPTTHIVDPKVATETGFAADAKLTGDAIGELNKNLKRKLSVYSTGIQINTGNSNSVSITITDYFQPGLYLIDIFHNNLQKQFHSGILFVSYNSAVYYGFQGTISSENGVITIPGDGWGSVITPYSLSIY